MTASQKSATCAVPYGAVLLLDAINSIPVLTPDEERALIARAQAGDREARETFLCANLRLVKIYAFSYAKEGVVEFSDLFTEGFFGLNHALDKFDLSKGYRFSTYAVAWIRQAMWRARGDLEHSMHIPMWMHDRMHAVNRALSALGGSASVQEIAAYTTLTPALVEEALALLRPALSLDVCQEDENHPESNVTLADLLEDPDSNPAETFQPDALQRSDAINAALAVLPQRERQIIEWRYALGSCSGQEPQTLQQIRLRLSLSRERVRQIEESALAKLRPVLARLLPDDALVADAPETPQAPPALLPTRAACWHAQKRPAVQRRARQKQEAVAV